MSLTITVVRDALRDNEITSRKIKDMVVKEAELEGKGYQIWAQARKDSEFSTFSPVLTEIIGMVSL